MRTTPTIAGSGTGRQMKYALTPAATARSAGTTIRVSLGLAMRLPPLDDDRRHHREHEVDAGEEPQSAPGVHPLPQARTELADANEAVDRKVRRENLPHRLNLLGDGFARPGEA